MRLFLGVLVLAAMVGCETVGRGTLKACRDDYVELKSQFEKGHLKSVRFEKDEQNRQIEKDWIKLAEAAISNIDKALENGK